MSAPKTAVLACGAWLKNAACVLSDDGAHWSAVHGDLSDPANCAALAASVEALVARHGAAIGAVAHDLHPDFFSTQLAQQVAQRLGVPAIAVQHHHAHIGVVMADYDLQEPVIGLALDGVGLGNDGTVWGGELLWLAGVNWRRLGHLRQLALPGGDAAAREPWRMAAAALHALNRGGEIEARFAEPAGAQAARTVHTMLERGLNCPPGSAAGRWFDAAAGALGVSVRQGAEAEAAIALEQLAHDYLYHYPELDGGGPGLYVLDADGGLDLRPLLAMLLDVDQADGQSVARAAALFHLTLADALAEWAGEAAELHGATTVALGGGCFLNRILNTRLTAALRARELHVLTPRSVSCGDAGLALGQAWVARRQLALAARRAKFQTAVSTS